MPIVSPATATQRRLLENLMQLYAYDYAEITGAAVDEDGRFAGPSLEPYFAEEGRHPFVLRVDGHPAGFALVTGWSRLTGDAGTRDMAEFFVMRPYRRRGVGKQAAFELFDRFPGPWEVRERAANTAATSFWRRVIAAYTDGRYTETSRDDERWRGPVQSFDAGSKR
jgi:predicted acetyltransferase